MQQDPIKKMENTAYITLFAGIALGFWQWYAQSNQWEFIALAGICWTVAIFDFLLITYAKNRDPSKASPAVLPLVLALLVMLILGPLLTITNVVQYFKAQDNVSYAVKKDTGIVRRVYGGEEHVELADTYKDKPVTVIEKQALFGRSSMKTIKLPSELKKIRVSAFHSCKGLTELELPDGVEVIERSAFQSCKNLKRIVIPPSVTKIPKSAFNGCPKDMVIAGEPGSAAQTFAEKYFTFEALSP